MNNISPEGLIHWLMDDSPQSLAVFGRENGYNERADVIRAADGTDLNDFWDEVNRTIVLRNQDRTSILDRVTTRVDGVSEEVTTPTEVEFEEATEFGQPMGVKGGAARFFRGFDFKFWDLAIRYTWMYIAEADVTQLRLNHNLALEADDPQEAAAAYGRSREVAAGGAPVVLILDLMLPGIGGLEICQTLRAQGAALPILMLSALGAVEDRVAGLRLGADDYLAKPFDFEELLARLEALARRGRDWTPATPSRLVVADLVFDRERMQASRAGQPLALTARELALLELMMSAPGRLFSRERILSNVWGASEDPLTNVVDVYIRRLRAKIDEGHARPLIHTVRGLGYRLEAPA